MTTIQIEEKGYSENKRYLVMQENRSMNQRALFISLIGAVSIYFMIMPSIIIDLFLWQYQNIYFRIFGIPKIDRDDYIIMDRYKLDNLNFWQKLNCVYCGYVNGVIAFAKDVANQTEIYSCAIKHEFEKKGQDHQKDFYEWDNFK